MRTGKLVVLATFLISLGLLSALAAHEYDAQFEAAQATSNDQPAPSRQELTCLAEAIYFESRGEPPVGRLAVGRVVLNRVASKAYPDTICAVVYQNAERRNRCQFSFACDGKPEDASERAAWFDALGSAWRLARCAAACPAPSLLANPLWRSTHFHADYVNPKWASKLASTGQIGRHLFYRDPSVAPYRDQIFKLSARIVASLFAVAGAIEAL